MLKIGYVGMAVAGVVFIVLVGYYINRFVVHPMDAVPCSYNPVFPNETDCNNGTAVCIHFLRPYDNFFFLCINIIFFILLYYCIFLPIISFSFFTFPMRLTVIMELLCMIYFFSSYLFLSFSHSYNPLFLYFFFKLF